MFFFIWLDLTEILLFVCDQPIVVAVDILDVNSSLEDGQWLECVSSSNDRGWVRRRAELDFFAEKGFV